MSTKPDELVTITLNPVPKFKHQAPAPLVELLEAVWHQDIARINRLKQNVAITAGSEIGETVGIVIARARPTDEYINLLKSLGAPDKTIQYGRVWGGHVLPEEIEGHFAGLPDHEYLKNAAFALQGRHYGLAEAFIKKIKTPLSNAHYLRLALGCVVAGDLEKMLEYMKKMQKPILNTDWLQVQGKEVSSGATSSKGYIQVNILIVLSAASFGHDAIIAHIKSLGHDPITRFKIYHAIIQGSILGGQRDLMISALDTINLKDLNLQALWDFYAEKINMAIRSGQQRLIPELTERLFKIIPSSEIRRLLSTFKLKFNPDYAYMLKYLNSYVKGLQMQLSTAAPVPEASLNTAKIVSTWKSPFRSSSKSAFDRVRPSTLSKPVSSSTSSSSSTSTSSSSASTYPHVSAATTPTAQVIGTQCSSQVGPPALSQTEQLTTVLQALGVLVNKNSLYPQNTNWNIPYYLILPLLTSQILSSQVSASVVASATLSSTATATTALPALGISHPPIPSQTLSNPLPNQKKRKKN